MGIVTLTKLESAQPEQVNGYTLTSNGEALAYFDSFEEARSIAEGMGNVGSVLVIQHLPQGDAAMRSWTYEPGSKHWVEIS
jgi:hypothetical protein